MDNFIFYSPTLFAFGDGEGKNTGALVRRFGGSKVLLVTGGGSVKRNGAYDAVVAYGINMIYFGVVMVIVLCIGLAMPPVGINLYVASSVGGQPVHKIIPHLPIPLLAIFVGTVIVILVPEIITFLPIVL